MNKVLTIKKESKDKENLNSPRKALPILNVKIYKGNSAKCIGWVCYQQGYPV